MSDMDKALELDGEKLRALTGQDHGPFKTAQAICERCDGQGWYPIREDNGEGDPDIEDCPDCNASGMLPVGVFDPVCARHCHLCEGADHHWCYEGDQDTEGNPLIGCRHCLALRDMGSHEGDSELELE